MGHFDISWGLGAYGWRSMAMKTFESRKCFKIWAWPWIFLMKVKLSLSPMVETIWGAIVF